MHGTVFAAWLQDVFQEELKELVKTLPMIECGYSVPGYLKTEGLYGLNVTPNGSVQLAGACGLSSIITIAEVLGLTVEKMHNKKGHLTGFYVTRGYD